jgi:hypothetical protein
MNIYKYEILKLCICVYIFKLTFLNSYLKI